MLTSILAKNKLLSKKIHDVTKEAKALDCLINISLIITDEIFKEELNATSREIIVISAN